MAFNRDNRSGGFKPRPSFGDKQSFSSSRPRFNDQGSRGPVEMHQAVCASCNKNCQVPFRPSGGKPVYCSDCFEQRGGNDSRGFENRPRRPERLSFNENNTQPRSDTRFEEINAKLDKILSLLTTAIEEPPKKVVTKKSTKKKSPAG